MVYDAYIILSLLTVLFSYGFVDANLTLSENSNIQVVLKYLSSFVQNERYQASMMYVGIIIIYFVLYLYVLHLVKTKLIKKGQLLRLSLIVAALLTVSYAAFSYDVFNYILTAKLAFLYKENPYVVMPIEIVNEPMLAFTRAANKYALYAPGWILFTYIPFILGAGNVWLTMTMYKAINLVFYVLYIHIIYKETKSVENIALFSLNPLILFELMVTGHNDMSMMLPAVLGLMLVRKKKHWEKLSGYLVYIFSVCVKFATAVLVPVFIIKSLSKEKTYLYASGLMFGVFLLTPFREEMYPWYAVWFLVFTALLPVKKYFYVHMYAIALSFGLLLRHAPYIATGIYEGIGPMIRTGVTVIPVALVTGYLFIKKFLLRFINK